MNDIVYLRPLVPDDALESYKWRNNPKIWRLTGSRPDRYITPEMERQWIEKVLKNEDQRRFAICLSSNDKYIGNVYLTDITDKKASVHIFIGDIEYWGSGRAIMAVKQILAYAFRDLKLEAVLTEINQKNMPSLSLAKALGFKKLREFFSEQYQMTLVELIFTADMMEPVTA